MQKPRILLLYPDRDGLALLASMLKSSGYLIEAAVNNRRAVRLSEREDIDLVLAGVDPGDTEARELLTDLRRKHRHVPVVLLFPRLHPERAKEALRWGAMAVLKYPVSAAELRAAVLQAPGARRRGRASRRRARPRADPARRPPRRRTGSPRPRGPTARWRPTRPR